MTWSNILFEDLFDKYTLVSLYLEDCPEQLDFSFLKYVWNYPRSKISRRESTLKEFSDGQNIIYLKNISQINKFMSSLQR